MCTMLSMLAPIDIYEEMSAISARMVEAARNNDWENLIRLEKSVMALRLSLTADDNNRLTPQEMDIKRALIQRILDDDAEVRRHTEPWMEQVRQFLSGDIRSSPVGNACGASP